MPKKKDIDVKLVSDLYLDKGWMLKDIAKVVNMHPSNLSEKMKEAGIKKSNKYDELDKETLKHLLINEKLTSQEIADKYNCSEALINKRSSKFNINVYENRENSSAFPLLTKANMRKWLIEGKLTRDDIANIVGSKKSVINYYFTKYKFEMIDIHASYELNDIQSSLIIGNCLGDGCLTRARDNNSKYAFMHIGHAENQKHYLEYQYKILNKLCASKINERKYSDKNNYQTYYYFTTRPLPLFYSYLDMSEKDYLLRLDKESFIIWLLDDGTKEGRNDNAYSIACGRFSQDEIEFAIDVLKEKFDLNATIHKNKSRKNGHSGIRFSVEESKKISNMINSSKLKNMVYNTMSYKIIDK